MELKKLHEPFPAADLEWRVQSCGKKNNAAEFWVKVLAYVTNRAIMERLDNVCGQENWQNVFREWIVGNHSGVMCGISIRVGDEWVTKFDGAENTEIEAIKGGISSAMKRAAVQWGIGRYLYGIPEGWGIPTEKGEYSAKTKEGTWFRWNPPALPVWALPQVEKKPDPQANGNGKPDANASTPEQHATIRKMAAEMNLDIERDILSKMGKRWPPTKADAVRIIQRLKELKSEEAQR